MTSLTDAYDGAARSVAGRRRRRLGTALFAVGVVAVVVAITIATTGLRTELGLSIIEARELAGVLAGLGLPAVFVGIFTVLPTSPTTRAAASIGASLAVFGVILFVYAYPARWLGAEPAMAVATILLYGTGALTTFWCMFIGLATFNQRDDPGGTARMEVTETGRLRVIRNTTGRSIGHGAVGLFGSDPDGNVATQTNQGGSAGGSSTSAEADEGVVLEEPTPSTDGGGTVADPGGAADEVVEAASTRGRPDSYCGNCTHFSYVRADGDLAPYCGLHDELMEDMDACDQWRDNSDPGPR